MGIQIASDDGWSYNDLCYMTIRYGRQPTEMILRSVAVHMACFYAFGHLLGLQGHSVRNQQNMVIGCLLFPLCPAVLLLRDAFDSFCCFLQFCTRNRRWSTRGASWRYYLSGALGVQIQPSTRGEGLAAHVLSCDPSHAGLNPKRKDELDWRWRARLFFWFVFIAEAVMSFYVVCRRMTLEIPLMHEGIGRQGDYSGFWWRKYLRQFADSPLDHWNGAVILGGIATGVGILGILLVNTDWEKEPRAVARPGQQRAADNGLKLLHLAAFAELLIVGRTIYVYYYRTMIWFAMSDAYYQRSAGVRAIPLGVAVFALVMHVGGFVSLLYLALLAIKSVRGMRFGEDQLFTFGGHRVWGQPLACFTSAKLVLVISIVQVFAFIYADCQWDADDVEYCPVPFYLWKDPLADQLYVL